MNDELPSNLEAEQQLLGAILMNDKALNAVVSGAALEAFHFSEKLHETIYSAFLELKKSRKAISPITVMPYLDKSMKVGDLTVAQYLSRLASETAGAYNIINYAQLISESYAARVACQGADYIKTLSISEWHTEGFADALQETLTAIKTAVDSSRHEETERPGDAYMRRFEASIENDGSVGVPIGMKEIADILNEPVFEAGNYYGLLSSSGEGKTSLVMQLKRTAIDNGNPVLFLSYDQSAAQCVAQLVSQEFGITSNQQKNPSHHQYGMKENEQEKAILFANSLNSKPYEIVRCHRETNARLLGYARRFVAKYRSIGLTPLIVIDHIKKIKSTNDRLSPDRQAGDISVEWKAFADEENCAVLMLNQRNTEGTKRPNPRPISRDIYGGEGAKEDYDAILYLYRPSKYKKDMLATAADGREVTRIEQTFAEFGDEDAVETVAEVGAIKVRFGDPSVKRRLRFEAKYTRYTSIRDQSNDGYERMF
jgi:replicative DNA helicase